MLKKGNFKKPNITREQDDHAREVTPPSVPDNLFIQCTKCRTTVLSDDLAQNGLVCAVCGFHYRMSARQRIDYFCDEDSFEEHDANLCSHNPIDFPGYVEKLESAQAESGELEAVVTGTARIDGHACCLFAMEPSFMMGSMGSVVGEKVTRLFEYADSHAMPVVGFTVSGGARMQEGILSLMQMAKTSAAVHRHSENGGLYIAVLTDPTTGGVTASFAMEADIILAEPGALIAFAGPRVIEQTIKQKLPTGFQRAEFLLENGFADAVVDRSKQKRVIANLLSLHQNDAAIAYETEAM